MLLFIHIIFVVDENKNHYYPGTDRPEEAAKPLILSDAKSIIYGALSIKGEKNGGHRLPCLPPPRHPRVPARLVGIKAAKTAVARSNRATRRRNPHRTDGDQHC